MIKLFRKIRQKLLSENKFSSYLLYATGEIVLVVLGILIALNLNNRSDQQKRIVKTEAILEDIMEDLATDIEVSSFIISDYHTLDSLTSLVLNNKVTKEDYANRGNARLMYLVEVALYYHTSHNAYDVLSNNIGDIPTRFNGLMVSLNALYKQVLPDVSAYNERMRTLVEDHHSDHARNYDWYYQLPYSNSSSAIEYRLFDPKYKNKVRRMEWEGVRTHRNRIVEYRIAAIDCYLKIANTLNKPIDTLAFLIKKNTSESYLGTYLGEDDVILELKIEEDHLVMINTQKQTDKHIYPLTETDFFALDEGVVRFEKDNSDEGVILTYLIGDSTSSYVRQKN